MDLLIYLPADAKKPSPLLLNISFSANSTCCERSRRQARPGLGRENNRGATPTGMVFRKDQRGAAAENTDRPWPPFITATLTPTFWAAFHWECGALPPARAGRVGRHRGLGMGLEPRHGLPGNRQAWMPNASAITGASLLGRRLMWAGAPRHALRHGMQTCGRQLFG